MSEIVEIVLKRTTFTEISTIGEIYMPDGSFQCYCLEDVIRNVKVPGRTAIPSGTFEIVIAWSNRYQRLMPRLLDVPFYKGILIHSGNTPSHTDGCLLVGRKAGTDLITESVQAFDELFPKIRKLAEKGKTYMRIDGGFPSDRWVTDKDKEVLL